MRIEIPELTDLVFETQITPRWADMDALGHINGVQYLRYLEEVRMRWLADIDALPDPTGTGPVLVNAFCNYHREAIYPVTLQIRLYIGTRGRTSLDTFATLTNGADPSMLFATGGATIVWMDFVAGRPIILPDHFRN